MGRAYPKDHELSRSRYHEFNLSTDAESLFDMFMLGKGRVLVEASEEDLAAHFRTE